MCGLKPHREARLTFLLALVDFCRCWPKHVSHSPLVVNLNVFFVWSLYHCRLPSMATLAFVQTTLP